MRSCVTRSTDTAKSPPVTDPDRSGVFHARLVRSLANDPSSQLIGALCGAAVAITVALLSTLAVTVYLALATSVVAALRIASSYCFASGRCPFDENRAETIFQAVSLTFAVLVGLLSASVVLGGEEPHLLALMCGYTLAYAITVASRCAARADIAMGQYMLAAGPLAAALLVSGSKPLMALAITICLIGFSILKVVRNMETALFESARAAEDSTRLAEDLQRQALTDTLTGLSSRAGLERALARMCRDLPAGRTVALLWLDLHRIKQVNDTLGHAAGDELLREVAGRLRQFSPEGAVVSRFASDEFVLAAPLEGRKAAEDLARLVQRQITRAVRLEGQTVEIGASMGVALLPEDAPDCETLMKHADMALTHAKLGHRNTVLFYDPSMTHALVRRGEIEADLRAALSRDELSIYFQPIIDLETGRIRSFEALVRWFHPEKGELLPDEFIPVAEESGLIITLGNRVTAQAAKAAACWPEHVSLAVNLSPTQIRAPGAALGILGALREAGLDPRRLELEVTESLFLDDDANTARFMNDLASQGVRFALDDFGTGYSSLAYINRFPFRTIKVDRSFVSGPSAGLKTDAIIRAVAEMGTTLQMDIVAEGLETVEQVQAVHSAGCTLGQGFYFSRAVPEHVAAVLLADESDATPLHAAGSHAG